MDSVQITTDPMDHVHGLPDRDNVTVAKDEGSDRDIVTDRK